MAWEKRGSKTYFYRSVRRDGKVTKVYYGAGQTGKLAANAVALLRAEKDAGDQERRRASDQLDAAIALNQEMGGQCNLLATASLMAAGFHQPGRHGWRRWNHGRRTLKANPG